MRMGFRTHKEDRKLAALQDRSVDMGLSSPHYYTLWIRIRIALLFLAGVDSSELVFPIKKNISTAKQVSQWVDENRSPQICEAFKRAAEVRGEKDGEE